MTVSGERIELVLISVDGAAATAPVLVRLRGALKVLLRSFGLRAISVKVGDDQKWD
jgi:hypothetical protein